MSRMVGAAVERRLALALLLGGTGVFLFLSLTTTTSAPSTVVLAAVAAAIAAMVGPHRLPVTLVCSPSELQLRGADEVAALRAGHVTDSPRHPLRPRAPGLV